MSTPFRTVADADPPIRTPALSCHGLGVNNKVTLGTPYLLPPARDLEVAADLGVPTRRGAVGVRGVQPRARCRRRSVRGPGPRKRDLHLVAPPLRQLELWTTPPPPPPKKKVAL